MNKNHLIIAVLSIVVILLCCGIAYMLLADNTEYVTINTVENGTAIDVPKDMVVKSQNDDSGIVVLENDNTIVVFFNSQNQGLAQIMGFANIKNPIFGSEFYGNVTLNDPTVAGCSLKGECNAVYVGNNDTHDNIIVISKNRDIVNHIINSIKWAVAASANEDSSADSNVESADSSPSAYAYKSDGTPMYSEDEVNDYMLNKYGMVDYHVGDNGYIDMDEPGYDDAGNKIDNGEK